jgi:HPt (histidine-containing phosphotransfer) domain-containing protein
MDDYVSKPIDPAKLIAAIHGQLKARQRSAISEPATPAIPSSDPVDYFSLVNRCMGNSKLADKLLGKFRDAVVQDLARLKESVAAGDGRLLARQAHTLKGGAANLSVEAVRAIAADLEHLGKQADLSTAEAKIEQLKLEIDRCVAYIDSRQQQPADRPGVQGLSAVVKELALPAAPPAKPAGYQTGDPIDVADVLQRCMGNVEFLQRLLGKFRKRLGEDVNRLTDAVSARNQQEIARQAHSLRGSAANVSAIQLAGLASEAEKLSAAGDLNAAGAVLEKIRREADRCMNYEPDLSRFAAAHVPKA